MRYMMLIYTTETTNEHSPEEKMAGASAHIALMAETKRRGIFHAADPLEPTSTATTVRVKAGKVMVTDGPFAETKEQLAGYYVLDCKDLDEAIEWASKIPTVCGGNMGCVEVRAIRQMPEAVRMLLEAEFANS
jgi:hypothetical protein